MYVSHHWVKLAIAMGGTRKTAVREQHEFNRWRKSYRRTDGQRNSRQSQAYRRREYVRCMKDF